MTVWYKSVESQPLPQSEPTNDVPISATTQPAALPTAQETNDFESLASNEVDVPLWKDFSYFLIHNKKWWLIPILVTLLVLSLLMLVSSSAAAPFIYTLF